MHGSSWEVLEKSIVAKIELLSKVGKDTIYFDRLQTIERKIYDISNRNVVFIDDLDRRLPKTALGVFESIKVFLRMGGLVYIIILSHETISKLMYVQMSEDRNNICN